MMSFLNKATGRRSPSSEKEIKQFVKSITGDNESFEGENRAERFIRNGPVKAETIGKITRSSLSRANFEVST